MEQVNIRITKSGDEEKITVLAEIGIGKLSKEKGVDERGLKYITIPIGNKAGMQMMENVILRYVDVPENEDPKEVYDTIRQYLVEYAKYYMLDLMGVTQTPILKREDGSLIGFHDDVEVNIVSENKEE